MEDYGTYLPEDMPSEVTATPVLQMIFAHADTTPDALAIVAHGEPGREVRLTYGELRQQVVAMADGLRRNGVKPGDSIGILLDNTHAYQAVITILASSLLAAIFVPLNARSVARELADAIKRSGCRFILAAPESEETLIKVRPELNAFSKIILTIASDKADLNFDGLLAQGDSKAGNWPQIEMESVCEIMFTSGTTAAPKAVAIKHSATAATAHIFKVMLGLTSDDVVQSFFPIFTTASTKCVVLPILSAGGTAIFDPNMDVPEVVRRIQREKTTLYYAVPAFYIFLLELAANQDFTLDSVRLFMFGGAAMPEGPIRDLQKRFPHIGLGQTLGSTETGATGSVIYPRFMLDKMGSVGKAYPFTEVRLVDNNFNEVPVNTPGEFAVRSAAIFKEYLGDPENTAATLKDGWVLMGDIGERDKDGFLFHTDRKKDIIIRGGHNIGSMEIEGVLYQHLKVAEVAAVGVPHAKLGEDVFVFIVKAAGQDLTTEEILEYCRENLADYKVPRHVAFLDEMPRNAMGKIVKTTLRDDAKKILQ